jgi:hypothetical protein
MFDQSKGFTQQPVTAVIRNVPPRRIRWSEAGPYIVGIMGVVVATVALASFLMWKGSAQAQISQLRTELATAQSQAASQTTGTSASLSGLTRRVDSIGSDVNALGNLVGPFTSICTTDLTNSAGQAEAFVFACAPKS